MAKNKQTEFNDILIASIDEALSSLGEKAKELIYLHLKEKHDISKKDFLSKIDVFSDFLDKLFGDLGARQLEILIMTNLNRRVNCLFKWQGPKWLVPNLSFVKYVHLLKTRYLTQENPYIEFKVAFSVNEVSQ